MPFLCSAIYHSWFLERSQSTTSEGSVIRGQKGHPKENKCYPDLSLSVIYYSHISWFDKNL